jgi:AraC-like DNA-binding protein
MKEEYPKIYLYRRVVQAKLFIDNNYSQSIDVNNISNEASFSKFHFIRLFKKTYGRTPHQYLTFVRIEKAKELLKEGKGVSEACFSIGFESLSSFSGLFKRMSGLSPSTFMEKHRKKNTEIKTSPLRFVPGCYISNNGWAEE